MNQFGRVKIKLLLLVLILVGAVYCGVEIGGVYFRKYQLEEAVNRELSFVGQRTQEGIREYILGEIRGMNLPAEAQRFSLVRDEALHELRFTVAYTETVNLLVTTREIAVSLSVSRRY